MSLKRTPLSLAIALCSAALLTLSPPAQATLFDRGGGMVYDDATNLTWLQSWNAGAGKMSWADADAWAASLDIAGYSDWRLPQTAHCLGFNCRKSEFGALWYDSLGNVGGQPAAQLLPFTDVAVGPYWTGSIYAPGHAYYFNTAGGSQSVLPMSQLAYAVAVRVGDVTAPVPEPGALALWLAGLGAVTAVVRRRRPGPAR